MKFKTHSQKQSDALESEKPITLVGTGTQWGKTEVGALRMLIRLTRHTDPKYNFIVTAPTYKIMEQATLPAFMRRCSHVGDYRKGDAVFETQWGTRVFFRTETDPDSVVGITNAAHIWCDEAGKYGRYFWENLRARAAMLGCQIDLTTSPYSMNWIYRDIIQPLRKGTRNDICYISAASWENPYHALYDEEMRLKEKAQMDPRRFKMLYGGEWGRMEGLVYDCWDDEINLVDPFALPDRTKFYAGVDWGFTHPFVIKVRAVTPSGRHYGVSELYETNLTISDMIEAAKQKLDTWGIEMFYCDPSEPGYIEEFNRHGIPAIKANNDIRKGIDLHYQLIKAGNYKEFKGACPYSIDEREAYHYPELKDLKPDQHDKEPLPVDKDNHAMDVDRYLSMATYQKYDQTPKIIKPRLTRLQKLQRANKDTTYEKWS